MRTWVYIPSSRFIMKIVSIYLDSGSLSQYLFLYVSTPSFLRFLLPLYNAISMSERTYPLEIRRSPISSLRLQPLAWRVIFRQRVSSEVRLPLSPCKYHAAILCMRDIAVSLWFNFLYSLFSGKYHAIWKFLGAIKKDYSRLFGVKNMTSHSRGNVFGKRVGLLESV